MVSIETRTDVQQRPLYSLHYNSEQNLLCPYLLWYLLFDCFSSEVKTEVDMLVRVTVAMLQVPSDTEDGAFDCAFTP